MKHFIEGAITMGNVVVVMFFLRFWKKTGDRFFATFAFAFSLMAMLRLAETLVQLPSLHVHYLYLLRLLAYLVIICAIVDKNRSATRAR